MRDAKVSEPRLLTLHPTQIPIFRKAIETAESRLDITIRVIVGFRTAAQQDAEYAKGRTVKGSIVTAAKAWESYHCYGFAIDCVPIVNGLPNWQYDFSKIAEIFKEFGLTWGSPWKDYDHFESDLGRGPHGWHFLRDLHQAGNVDANGFVILAQDELDKLWHEANT